MLVITPSKKTKPILISIRIHDNLWDYLTHTTRRTISPRVSNEINSWSFCQQFSTKGSTARRLLAERWWWYRMGYKDDDTKRDVWCDVRCYLSNGSDDTVYWMKKYSWRSRLQGGDIYQSWDVHWFHMVIVSWKKVFFWCLSDVCVNDKKKNNKNVGLVVNKWTK